MGLISSFRQQELTPGFHNYLAHDDPSALSFAILKLSAGQDATIASPHLETAVVLIQGQGALDYHDETITFNRPNWREHNPTVVHISCEERLTLKAQSDCRFAVIQTPNRQSFAGRVYKPAAIGVEHRGQDLLEGTCYRLVRLAFDRSIAPANAKLVLGEVLNYPGRWSSYPPHHHPQHEVYYYEFDPPTGYGHGEIGESVYKIYHQDLLSIPGGQDHSQVAAPGFHLYYIWAIRHLDEQPYTGFTFTKPYDALLKKS